MKRKPASLLGVGAGQPSNRGTGGGQQAQAAGQWQSLASGLRDQRRGAGMHPRHTSLNTSKRPPHLPFKKSVGRTSLVVQWLRMLLPMQRTRVQSLAQEGLTCRGATKPVHHNS